MAAFLNIGDQKLCEWWAIHKNYVNDLDVVLIIMEWNVFALSRTYSSYEEYLSHEVPLMYKYGFCFNVSHEKL